MSEDNFLQPEDDTTVGVMNPEEQMPGLAAYVKGKFDDAENGRYAHEQRWLQAYKNFALIQLVEAQKNLEEM